MVKNVKKTISLFCISWAIHYPHQRECTIVHVQVNRYMARKLETKFKAESMYK